MVEHSTADREVPGSNPGAPSTLFFFFFPYLSPFYISFAHMQLSLSYVNVTLLVAQYLFVIPVAA